MNNSERQELAAQLAAVPRSDLLTLGERLATRHHLRHGTVPHDGLYLLTMEDGVHRDHFYLGEIPVATAVIELDTSLGTVRGGASLLGATVAQAEAAALCDAIASHHLDGADEVLTLAQRGECIRSEIATQRAQMCAATRVTFSDLSEGDTIESPSDGTKNPEKKG